MVKQNSSNQLEAQELCEQAGVGGLSHSKLDSLLLQMFSAAGSLDTVLLFVTLLHTTAERASCKAH